jgi:hypothetical protein
MIDSPRLTAVLRALVLGAAVLVVVVAFFGPSEVPRNLAPWTLYVTFWVGIVPVSLLLGPVWGRVNPLRTIYSGLRRVVGPPRAARILPRVGYWPAAVSLLAWAWVELVAPERSDPLRVGVFLAVYAAVHLAAAAVFGLGWFAQGEGFEVYSRFLGRMSPLGRREDGQLVLHSPLNGVAAQPMLPWAAAVVIVLVGSTAFDGLSRTTFWQDGPGLAGETAVRPSTVALAGAVTPVGLLYLTGCALSGVAGRYHEAAARYAHTMIPIAAGYAIAHYFSLLIFDGQTTFILASDPFGTGLNVLGVTGRGVDYTLVSTRTIALVQVGAIVTAHILGVILAHDRAIALAEKTPGGGHPVLSQIPLLAVMVTFTLGALGLLLGG